MNKLDKIEQDAQKARERIAAMQAQLRQIEGQRTEQENLQIVQQIRALKLSRDELYAFLSGAALPVPLAGESAPPAEPETIYTQRERTRRHAPEAVAEPGIDNQNTESEGIKNEE